MDHRGSPRPPAGARSPHPRRPGYAVEQVIAWLEVVSAANRRMAGEVEGCRAAVSQTTIDRLTQRAGGLRPWAAAPRAAGRPRTGPAGGGDVGAVARRRARERSPGSVPARAEAGWWTGRSA